MLSRHRRAVLITALSMAAAATGCDAGGEVARESGCAIDMAVPH